MRFISLAFLVEMGDNEESVVELAQIKALLV